MEADFSGYATKNNLKCSDGRTIRANAFKSNDGQKVPLVWRHQHNEPSNVLGHALLENREDGVYAYGYFNNGPYASTARELIKHGDIRSLSIYANNLIQKGGDVFHGDIREVSLVLSGANPGAFIDNVYIRHGDDEEIVDDEAIIYTGVDISLQHGDDQAPVIEQNEEKDNTMAQGSDSESDETVQDVFDTLSDKQKQVVYYLIGQAVDGGDAQHSDEDDSDTIEHDNEGDQMFNNVFDRTDDSNDRRPTLSHEQLGEIFSDASRLGSLKESFLAHAGTYGIDNIDYLFPDARNVTNPPTFISRDMEWVSGVLSGTHHSPFSRIKSMAADITVETARARGYVKGNLKKEEVFGLLKRVTTPTTIYKKQKLDRDDITDITDLDVVAWLKAEMRVMLNEEIARAIFVGDGRDITSEDKIDETHIRPILTDDDMYAEHVLLPSTTTWKDIPDEFVRSRKNYKGSGSPKLYAPTGTLTELLLLKDSTGRRLYSTKAELASALLVSDIVEVPVFDGVTRTVGAADRDLVGIIVNLSDYTIGADNGGNLSMFDDFDIDYNQYKYLIETRISGTLTLPKSALVLEKAAE